jgi:hypothetical protein
MVSCLGLFVVALIAASPRPAFGQEYRIGGSDVAVYNLAGKVEVVGGGGSEVVVEVMTGGSDAGELRVLTGEIRGRETLRVVYPSDEIVYSELGRGSRMEIRVRDDGTFGDEGRGGDRVRISGSGDGLEAWADLRIRVPPGRDFAVYLGAGEATVENVEGDLRVDTGTGSVDASGVRGSLVVDTGSGSVVVQGVDGELSVDTGSGSVEVSGVRGPRLEVDTGSGSVAGQGISVGSLVVDTGSGSVELSEVACSDVMVDTGSGSVELDLLDDVERLIVDTGSGGVTLTVPDDLGARVEVDSGSGGIDADLPIEIEAVRRTYLRGTIGDGRGSIEIDTGSGGIKILRR